jgi:hypothetical protein
VAPRPGTRLTGSVRTASDHPLRMSKRSRQRPRPAPRPQLRHQTNQQQPKPGVGVPAPPERLLLDQIADGVLDEHLTAISEAVHARHELLATVNSHKALAMLNVGDRVRINHHAKPRYLHGIHGIVVELNQSNAIVCMHRPVGRFKSGEIRCPPLILDRLNPAA